MNIDMGNSGGILMMPVIECVPIIILIKKQEKIKIKSSEVL